MYVHTYKFFKILFYFIDVIINVCMYDRYADISRLHAWNLDFVENLPAGSRYREMCSKVDESLRFMKAIGVDTRSVHI